MFAARMIISNIELLTKGGQLLRRADRGIGTHDINREKVMPGWTELLIIAGVVVLLFGTTKLPKLGGAIGESIKNFKKGIKDEESSNARLTEKKDDDITPPKA